MWLFLADKDVIVVSVLFVDHHCVVYAALEHYLLISIVLISVSITDHAFPTHCVHRHHVQTLVTLVQH